MNTKMRSSIALPISMLLVFLSVLLLQSCWINWRTPERIDVTDVNKLDPKAVVDLYWRASIVGDTDAIRRIIGSSGNSMLWECQPSQPDPNLPRFVSLSIPENNRSTEDEYPGAEHVGDKTESILLHARVITIGGSQFANRYELAEEKTFGRESRILLRPKEDTVPSRGYVFFLLHNGERWTLVDVESEDQLYRVGNKRFGEQRDCPESVTKEKR